MKLLIRNLICFEERKKKSKPSPFGYKGYESTNPNGARSIPHVSHAPVKMPAAEQQIVRFYLQLNEIGAINVNCDKKGLSNKM